MGSSVSCVARDQDESPVRATCQPRAKIMRMLQHDKASSSYDDELKAQSDTTGSSPVVKPAARCTAENVDEDTIRHFWAAWGSENGLQDQIDAIVGAHTESLRQQRLAMDLASTCPRPAKSVADLEVEYWSNLAHDRRCNTPHTAPPSFSKYDKHDDIKPCKLSFDEPLETQNATSENPSAVSVASMLTSLSVQASDVPKLQTEKLHTAPFDTAACPAPTRDHSKNLKLQTEELQTMPFDITSCPSPVRNRAKNPKLQTEELQSTPMNITACPSPTRNRAKRQMGRTDTTIRQEELQKTQQLAAEDEQFLQRLQLRTATEDKQKRSLQRLQSAAFGPSMSAALHAKWLQEYDLKVEMAARDKLCVDTFLESVKRSAWQECVRLSSEGIDLPAVLKLSSTCSACVHVKDSSFKTLAFFLQFLETEGLLSLMPGLSPPVVIEIDLSACLAYKYKARQQERFTSAVAEAILAVDGADSCRRYKYDAHQRARFLATPA